MVKKKSILSLSFIVLIIFCSVNESFARNFIISKHSTFSTFDVNGYSPSGKMYLKLFEETIDNTNVKISAFQIEADGRDPVSGNLIWDTNLEAFISEVELAQYSVNDILNVTLQLEANKNRAKINDTISVSVGNDLPVADGGADHINAGYGTTVELDGRSSSGDELAYSWSISNGNDNSIVELIDNADGTASFTLPAFEAIVNPEPYQPVYDNAKMFAMTYDMMGAYEVKLTVTDKDGETSVDYVEITATSRSSGLKNVPFGKPVFAVAPEQESYSWIMTSKPDNSVAVLNDASSRISSFTPDVVGKYVVQEAISQSEIEINSGTFVGVGLLDGEKRSELPECSACHKIVHQAWLGTHHSFALTNKYNGVLTDGETPFPFFREFCIKCHTTGFDRGDVVDNKGFDDAARKEGWTFPLADENGNVNPENFNDLIKDFPLTASKAQVQCEMCHGPGNKPHVFDKSNIDRTLHPTTCGQCHSFVPARNRYVEWLGSAHARSVRMKSQFASGVPAGVNPENPANGCGVHCHTVEGFLKFRVTGSSANPEMYAGRRNDAAPVSCILCHAPMNNFNNADSEGLQIEDGRKQLRFYGKTTIPKWNEDETEVINVEVDAGPAAICTKCHLHNMYLKDYSGDVKPEPVPFKVGEGVPTHHQAQMYFGIGASEYGPDEFGLGAYPPPTHVTAFREEIDNPKYCVHCHMFRYSTRDEQFGKMGSHTWEMVYTIEDEQGRGEEYDTVLENAKPCFDCHEGAEDNSAPGGYSFTFAESGEQFLEELVEQLSSLLPVDVRGSVVWSPDGDDFGTPDDTSDDVPPLSSIEVKAAFNYYFVVNDKSDGHHNMDYAVRLVSDAIRSLGETPIEKSE